MGLTLFAGPPRNELLESYIYTQIDKYAKNATELIIQIKPQGKVKGYELRLLTKKMDGEDAFEVNTVQVRCGHDWTELNPPWRPLSCQAWAAI